MASITKYWVPAVAFDALHDRVISAVSNGSDVLLEEALQGLQLLPTTQAVAEHMDWPANKQLHWLVLNLYLDIHVADHGMANAVVAGTPSCTPLTTLLSWPSPTL